MRTKEEIMEEVRKLTLSDQTLIEVLCDIRDLWKEQVETTERMQLDQASATEMLERVTHDQHVVRQKLVGRTEAEEMEQLIEELPEDGPVSLVSLSPCCEHAMHGALGSTPPESTFQCGVCGNLWVIEKDGEIKLMGKGEGE